jgi:uncharacterized protein (DUF433 family)
MSENRRSRGSRRPPAQPVGGAATHDHSFVEESPGIGGGYPQVRGTRTPVRVVVQFMRQADNLEQVAEALPHLSREQIRGALDYHAAHRERVDEDIERNARTMAELQGRRWPD